MPEDQYTVESLISDLMAEQQTVRLMEADAVLSATSNIVPASRGVESEQSVTEVSSSEKPLTDWSNESEIPQAANPPPKDSSTEGASVPSVPEVESETESMVSAPDFSAADVKSVPSGSEIDEPPGKLRERIPEPDSGTQIGPGVALEGIDGASPLDVSGDIPVLPETEFQSPGTESTTDAASLNEKGQSEVAPVPEGESSTETARQEFSRSAQPFDSGEIEEGSRGRSFERDELARPENSSGIISGSFSDMPETGAISKDQPFPATLQQEFSQTAQSFDSVEIEEASRGIPFEQDGLTKLEESSTLVPVSSGIVTETGEFTKDRSTPVPFSPFEELDQAPVPETSDSGPVSRQAPATNSSDPILEIPEFGQKLIFQFDEHFSQAGERLAESISEALKRSTENWIANTDGDVRGWIDDELSEMALMLDRRHSL